MKNLCFARVSHACSNIINICCKEIAFVLRGRQCVGNAFEHGAYAARVLADTAQRLDDGAAFVEDDIAVLADEFKGERARDNAAAARDDVDIEMQDAVAPLLTYGGDAACFELLA